MNKAAMHANRKEDWETPRSIFDPLNAIFKFTIDLAARKDNRLCDVWVGPGSHAPDFLKVTASDLRTHRGWINPPYGRHLESFTRQIKVLGDVVPIVALLPASFDVEWFHGNVLGEADLYCRRGRIQFLYKGKRPLRRDKSGRLVPNSNTGANILAVYGPWPFSAKRALLDSGWFSLG